MTEKNKKNVKEFLKEILEGLSSDDNVLAEDKE